MMRKVVVVSHERSGTHFLINTIIKNFGHSDGWDSGRSIVKSESLVDRWCVHVSGWKKHNVYMIKFSDLKRHFNGAVFNIGKVLGKPIGPITTPSLNHNVIESRSGREGDWKGHLSSEDNERVVKIVGKYGLGEFLG